MLIAIPAFASYYIVMDFGWFYCSKQHMADRCVGLVNCSNFHFI